MNIVLGVVSALIASAIRSYFGIVLGDEGPALDVDRGMPDTLRHPMHEMV